jgi:hypothetical protein
MYGWVRRETGGKFVPESAACGDLSVIARRCNTNEHRRRSISGHPITLGMTGSGINPPDSEVLSAENEGSLGRMT